MNDLSLTFILGGTKLSVVTSLQNGVADGTSSLCQTQSHIHTDSTLSICESGEN